MSPPDSSPNVCLPLTVCGLRCAGGFLAVAQQLCHDSGSQHYNNTIRTMALELKMALTKTPSHVPSTSTFTTAVVCEMRSSTIYWYFPLCCWQLSSLCVSINVLDSPLCRSHLCLQYWAKCLHNHTIRLIGSAQSVVVSCWTGGKWAASINLPADVNNGYVSSSHWFSCLCVAAGTAQ